MANADAQLVELVQQQLNRGTRHVILPADLVAAASEVALDEIRRLCKLNGASVEVRS